MIKTDFFFFFWFPNFEKITILVRIIHLAILHCGIQKHRKMEYVRLIIFNARNIRNIRNTT